MEAQTSQLRDTADQTDPDIVVVDQQSQPTDESQTSSALFKKAMGSFNLGKQTNGGSNTSAEFQEVGARNTMSNRTNSMGETIGVGQSVSIKVADQS